MDPSGRPADGFRESSSQPHEPQAHSHVEPSLKPGERERQHRRRHRHHHHRSRRSRSRSSRQSRQHRDDDDLDGTHHGDASHRHSYRERDRHTDSPRDKPPPHQSEPTTSNQPSRRRRRRSRSTSRRHSSPSSSTSPAPPPLPLQARTLSRWDFAAFEPLFAHWLDVQKQKQLASLSPHEVRGRWKSFVGKWNRGELAEGWYAPEMFLRVVRMNALGPAREVGLSITGGQVLTPPMSGRNDNSDDEGWGPALPGSKLGGHGGGLKPGPAIPSLQDLDARRDTDVEDRQGQIEDLRFARRADRAMQKEQLEELVPRADAGTRERQLEKKREVNDKMRGFRDREQGEMEPVGEKELMGGEDGVDDYKRMIASLQRRKTERQVRREEVTRARNQERDERVREYRLKEDARMDVLKELAIQRFGG